jgi:hypothetical protein
MGTILLGFAVAWVGRPRPIGQLRQPSQVM